MIYIQVCWEAIGNVLKVRPGAVIGAIIGLLIFILAQGYLLTTQPLQQRDLDNIKISMCVNEKPQPLKCQILLDALLDNANDAQKYRIYQFVKDIK